MRSLPPNSADGAWQWSWCRWSALSGSEVFGKLIPKKVAVMICGCHMVPWPMPFLEVCWWPAEGYYLHQAGHALSQQLDVIPALAPPYFRARSGLVLTWWQILHYMLLVRWRTDRVLGGFQCQLTQFVTGSHHLGRRLQDETAHQGVCRGGSCCKELAKILELFLFCNDWPTLPSVPYVLFLAASAGRRLWAAGKLSVFGLDQFHSNSCEGQKE